MKKLVSLLLTLILVFAVAACGINPPEEIAVETTEATTAATDAIPETTAYPTGVPLNQDAYVEFESPIAYNVIADADAYTDVGVQTYARTYVAGSMVIGVATDGHYIVLDDRTVVDSANLEAMQ